MIYLKQKIYENKKIWLLLSLPKTVFWCLYLFDLKTAIRLPIIFGFGSKVFAKRGSVEVASKSRVFFGFTTWKAPSRSNESIFWCIDGKIVFKGEANIADGSCIRVEKNGLLIIGENFYCSRNVFICSSKSIVIGNGTTIGYNSNVRDDDGHLTWKISEGKGNSKHRKIAPVIIGNHCWIASDVRILKGSIIKNGSIVAQGSVVTKSTSMDEHSVIAGIPAKMVSTGFDWEM